MNIFKQDHTRLPVLIEANNEEKHYFIQQKQHISHFIFRDECWRQSQDIVFQNALTSFDATAGPPQQQKILHIFACEGGKKIYYTGVHGSSNTRELLFHEAERKIEGLSCTSNRTNLYLLCLVTSEVRNMWWFYLFHSYPGTNQKWQGPLVLDFGYGSPRTGGYLGFDLLDNLFVIYLLQEGNTLRPVYRDLAQNPIRGIGETIYLQKDIHNASMPSLLVASDNSLHASWFGFKNNTLFLNYARKKPAGHWEIGFYKEIPFPTSPFISLSQLDASLLMIWENNHTFFSLISEDNGTTWNALTPKALEIPPNIVRFCPAFITREKQTLYGNTIHCLGAPPHVFQGPEQFAIHERKSPVYREIDKINILASKMMTHSQRIQNNNIRLNNQVEEKQEEINRMKTFYDAKNDYLRSKVDAQNLELQNIQNTLNKTLKRLQEKLGNQKKDFLTGQEIINKKIECLEKENTRLSKALARQTEGIMKLEREIATLKKEKHGNKSSFFNKLLNKIGS